MTRLQDLGMKLAVPFNHDGRLLNELKRYRRDIDEIYLPAPPHIVGSLRPWSGPPSREYMRQLPGIARRMGDLGIAINVVINILYLPFEEHPRVARYAASLGAMGICRFTIADLYLAQSIRRKAPDAEIVASVAADVDSSARARHWLREAGASRLMVPPILNKCPSRLSELARVGIPLEVLVNEGCLPGCPHVMQHVCAVGGSRTSDIRAAKHFTILCNLKKRARPWEHFQTEVLPFQVSRLRGRVKYLKLVGRDRDTDSILRELQRYTRLSSNHHEALGLGYREPAAVWDRIATCNRHCEACGWCEKTFRRANPGLFDQRSSHWGETRS